MACNNLPNIQTTDVFSSTTRPDPFSQTGWVDDFQSISFMPAHQHYSVEELRLHDYSASKGGAVRSNTGAHNFSHLIAPPGLVRELQPGLRAPVQAPHAIVTDPQKQIVTYSADIITFEVGKDDAVKCFTVHESVASAQSEFVRTALKRDWKEAKERRIPLPDDEPEVFDLYQKLLYTHRIFGGDVQASAHANYQLLVKCYLLGEKLIDPNFQDAVIDCIIYAFCATSMFDPTLTWLAYEGTPADSPLRRLWRDIYAWSGNRWWLEDATAGPKGVHPEFAVDLAKLHMSGWKGVQEVPFGGRGRAYHLHSGRPCNSTTT